MKTLYVYPNHPQAVYGFQEKLSDVYAKNFGDGYEIDYDRKIISCCNGETFYFMSLDHLKEIQFLDYDNWKFQGEAVSVYQDVIDFLNLNQMR